MTSQSANKEFAEFKNTQQTKWTLAFNKTQSFNTENVAKQAVADLDIKKQRGSGRRVEDFNKIFDSANNWSIMISKDLNDVRNEIMRRTKSNQIKRRIQSRVSDVKTDLRPIQTAANNLGSGGRRD